MENSRKIYLENTWNFSCDYRLNIWIIGEPGGWFLTSLLWCWRWSLFNMLMTDDQSFSHPKTLQINNLVNDFAEKIKISKPVFRWWTHYFFDLRFSSLMDFWMEDWSPINILSFSIAESMMGNGLPIILFCLIVSLFADLGMMSLDCLVFFLVVVGLIYWWFWGWIEWEIKNYYDKNRNQKMIELML